MIAKEDDFRLPLIAVVATVDIGADIYFSPLREESERG